MTKKSLPDKNKKEAEENIPRCSARKKKCSNPECGHRYKKGDKAWTYPKCDTGRRCKNKPVEGYNVCRMHGAGGGRPPGSKYNIARRIEAAFNRILGEPAIWEMVEQQAAMGARWEQLILKLDDLKHQGVDTIAVIKQVDRAMKGINRGGENGIHMAREALWEIRSLLDETYRENKLWAEILQITEFMRKNTDTQKKWARENLQLVPVNEVTEVLIFMQQSAFIFIPNPHDRKAYVSRIRSMFPPLENTELLIDGKSG